MGDLAAETAGAHLGELSPGQLDSAGRDANVLASQLTPEAAAAGGLHKDSLLSSCETMRPKHNLSWLCSANHSQAHPWVDHFGK